MSDCCHNKGEAKCGGCCKKKERINVIRQVAVDSELDDFAHVAASKKNMEIEEYYEHIIHSFLESQHTMEQGSVIDGYTEMAPLYEKL